MSGDVQPRKRKDKKRKKDEALVEEHRGTAAVFGEGDVLMHSQHDHGTGGHWCAKIIFFSLLAVLITLIGLIILENRGLSELEANSVESRYSGVLEGWIEDTPDDDHHDEHTLDLKHHDDDDELVNENDHNFDNHDNELDEEADHDEVDDDNDDHDEEDTEQDEEEEEDGDENEDEEEDDNDEEDEQDNDDDDDEDASKDLDDDDFENQEADESFQDDADNDDDNDEDDESEEQNIKSTEGRVGKYNEDDGDEDDDDDEDDEIQEREKEGLENDVDSAEDADDEDNDDLSNEVQDNGDNNNEQSEENDEENADDDDNSNEAQDDEDDEEHEEHEEEADEEVEKIEEEVLDQEQPESAELPRPEESVEKEEDVSVEAVSPNIDEEDERDFLEVDDLDEPAVEKIAPPPPGKPFMEIEDEVSTELPPDSLAEEEEYEKQQEELRQAQEQEAQSTHMWLKLAVGGALLAATHAVIRRATAPRDTPESEQEEHASREETPVTDRRMTLLLEEPPKVTTPQSIQPQIEEVIQKTASLVKAAPVHKQESEEIEEDEEVEEDQEVQETKNADLDKELYSEDENEADEEIDEDEEVEKKVELPKSIPKVSEVKRDEESEPEETPEDVEIVDDEQMEEEIEEEVEEEEISDVDDADLLTRLEAKYGRLPEPERPGQKHKDGGNSLEDDWPGEPSDAFWREQLDKAEQELRQGEYAACAERASAGALASSARAAWLVARARDLAAEALRDNRELGRAIAAYLHLLKMNERLSDQQLLRVALRTLDRIQFRGTYLNAEPVYRLLIRRFPNDVTYRNNLTISFLMANRADLASEVLKETLRVWPNDRVALAHYGFILKTEQNNLEEAVTYFRKALEGDAGAANEPRFYYHLGDALLMLGRTDEAHEVHKRGAELGHFLSPSQRSLYNVPGLESRPWWDVMSTPYAKLARELEASWRDILREGEAARELYEKEKEGLRERGEWSQLDIFVRGREVPGRCERAPVTCRIVRAEPAAKCRRGQVKFSSLAGGTHVRAHVGPTNCRLRMHLALSNTEHTYIRVDNETRQWQVGKVLMFDDSFEHEVWHNGTLPRLVLIVDVWHPRLPPHLRRTLPAI